MIRIRDLTILPGEGEDRLRVLAAQALRVSPEEIRELFLRRRSVDARKKPDIRMIYTVDVAVAGEEKILRSRNDPKIQPVTETPYQPPKAKEVPACRPVVVGFGPAGIFAALILAQAGCKPLVLERGRSVEERTAAVREFWNGGKLDPECNVQFGEGGAGTFSDGKLNTGTHDSRIGWVLEQFVAAGADADVAYDAKPHVGTDVLAKVVRALRQKIQQLGGEIRFSAKLTGITADGGVLTAVEVNGKEMIPCDRLILAVGHSARDTVSMLYGAGLSMEPKPFSMGVRIEHRQEKIDRAQYGKTGDDRLPPADYKLNVHLPDGGSAYTFCMCPGGKVVAAASEEGGVVTNGMSDRARDGENANAALLVTLRPEDFPEQDALGGMRWQREIEQKAFLAGGGNYHAPAQTVGSFLGLSETAPAVEPTYRPGVAWCDLHTVLPPTITAVLEKAIPRLGQKLRGFDQPGAVLTAPETRSSSPVRILRDENCQASLRGLYPCGEGAGYAGGITSAAVDGIRCAEAVLCSYAAPEYPTPKRICMHR